MPAGAEKRGPEYSRRWAIGAQARAYLQPDERHPCDGVPLTRAQRDFCERQRVTERQFRDACRPRTSDVREESMVEEERKAGGDDAG